MREARIGSASLEISLHRKIGNIGGCEMAGAFLYGEWTEMKCGVQVKLIGNDRSHEPYHVVDAKNAKEAAGMWYSGPLTENRSSSKLRVQVKYMLDDKTISTLFYEP